MRSAGTCRSGNGRWRVDASGTRRIVRVSRINEAMRRWRSGSGLNLCSDRRALLGLIGIAKNYDHELRSTSSTMYSFTTVVFI